TDEAGKNVIATTTVDIAAAPTTKAKLTMKSMQVSTTDGAKITVVEPEPMPEPEPDVYNDPSNGLDGLPDYTNDGNIDGYVI
ncbi:MAG: hypothetical protein IIW37_02400, partial [Bacteroidaceae bacterium]|nr:hypothetical protein [Bacteroidaceae bacterium]